MTKEHYGNDNAIVLFDGVCNLCESTVRFIINRDSRAQFRFASLQSDVGQTMLESLQYEDEMLSSVLLIEEGQLYRKSRAALRIARRLDGLWPLAYYLAYWIPAFIADPVYDYVGGRRYRWFGSKESCWIPTEEQRQRFL